MNPLHFKEDWNKCFPGVPPVTFLFKTELNSRWFRIHSLPESKRYAEDAFEWEMLLKRHNDIMADVFSEEETLYMVAASYEHDEYIELHPFSSVQSLSTFHMAPSEVINLHSIDPQCWDAGSQLVPMVSIIQWEQEKFNPVFMDVANDNARVYFFSPSKERVVAPYDGGIDLIFENSEQRNDYRNKYSHLLPQNEWGT